MTFKPYPWLTFFSLLVFAALITLGVWQVQRYGWKQQLNANIKAYAKTQPISLAALLSQGKAEDFKYRPVKISGHYLTDKQVLVRGQYKKSERVILYGFYVFTPFEYINADVTKHIMLERGFITENVAKTPQAFNKLPTGRVELNGHIKIAEKQGSFLPDNDLTKQIWFWRDIQAMGDKLQLKNVENFYISVSDNKLQDFPKVTKIEIKSANSHLSYLITWFALAAGLLILYIYMHIYSGRLYLNSRKPKNEETLK